MIDRDNAKRIAYEFIRGDGTNPDLAHVVIIEKSIREEPFGWVFFWNDKRFVDTGNRRYALCGNQPVVVLRTNGEALYLPYVPAPSESGVEAGLDAYLANFDMDARVRALAASLREQ
jgi:hypothetical protein